MTLEISLLVVPVLTMEGSSYTISNKLDLEVLLSSFSA